MAGLYLKISIGFVFKILVFSGHSKPTENVLEVSGLYEPSKATFPRWETTEGIVFVANLQRIKGDTVIFNKNGKIYEFPKNKLTSSSIKDAIAFDRHRYLENRGIPHYSLGNSSQLSGSLSLTFGEIPLGKSKDEIGITGEEKNTIFVGKGGDELIGDYLHPPSSVRIALKIDRQLNIAGAWGYDKKSMTSVSFENFSSKERFFGNVQFFFVGPSKRLALVSKQISVPFEIATLEATFAGLTKAFTDKVGVQPAKYEDEHTIFFDGILGNRRLKATGQFAIWSLSTEIVVIMYEFPPKKDNLAPVYIIHASKLMLQEYVNLQQKLESEAKDKASSVINSAF